MSTREDVYDALAASPVANLATGGIHWSHVVDQELDPPFCIFHLEGGSEQWAMGAAAIESESWIVKAAGPDGAVCEAIDAAAQLALHDAVGQFCRRVAPLAYSEVEHGATTYYRGSRYRVEVVK